MCGSTVIDGYAFYLGVTRFYEASPDLENSIRPITYLIRGSIFRPKHTMSLSDRTSLDIQPLGELIDMTHAHEATKTIDKVYALLGMSSDDPSTHGLPPDYRVSWKELFKKLIRFLLHKQVHVKTWDREERAVIRSKGCILGQVSTESDNGHKVYVKNIPEHLGFKGECHACWPLQASVKQIRGGDFVCRLQGAPKPIIIRPCKDYFTVIRIAAFPEDKLIKSENTEWLKLSYSTTVFLRDFLLVWDWESSPEKSQDPREYETLMQTHEWVSEQSKTELEDHLDKAIRIWDIALILRDLKEYEKAKERLREAIEVYEMAFGEEDPHMLSSQDGQTPLSWAAWRGHDTVVSLLLTKDNVDPDLKDSQYGRTPLSWAAEQGHEAVVKLLLATGKVDADSNDILCDRTPLSWAAEEGHETVVKLLLATRKVDADSNDILCDRTPLSWAAEKGHETVVKLLLVTDKIDVDSKDTLCDRTPLSWGARNGHKAVVELLLATGRVNVASPDPNGRTLLSWAAGNGYEAVVKLLLATGKINVETSDKSGRTPL